MDILLDLLESMGKKQKFYGPEWHSHAMIQAGMVVAIGTGDLEPNLRVLHEGFSQLPYALFYCGIALHFDQPSLMKLM